MLTAKLYKLLNEGVKNSGLELVPDLIPSDKGYYIKIKKNGKELDGFHLPTNKILKLVSLMEE